MLVKAALGRCLKVTLDIDAMVIESHKFDSKWSCNQWSGYEPMVSYLSKTRQMLNLRQGNVPSSQGCVEFVRKRHWAACFILRPRPTLPLMGDKDASIASLASLPVCILNRTAAISENVAGLDSTVKPANKNR